MCFIFHFLTHARCDAVLDYYLTSSYHRAARTSTIFRLIDTQSGALCAPRGQSQLCFSSLKRRIAKNPSLG
jgi:hypothetical protein